MSDKDVLGMLMGVALLAAAAGYILYICRHPERFDWLRLRQTSPKAPASSVETDRNEPDPA